MPAERIAMRRVREVLRLKTAGVGLNEIARRVGVAPSTVRLTLKRPASAGFSWPLPTKMTDTALEAALFTTYSHEMLGAGVSGGPAVRPHRARPPRERPPLQVDSGFRARPDRTLN